jgi:carboxypeptidase C (cathepsin A)
MPAYAAVWYHKRQEWINHLKNSSRKPKTAGGPYASALMKGDLLPVEERLQIVQELARFTGLSADFIERTNLRIIDQHFFKELLRESGRTVGRLDSRFLGIDRLGVTEQPNMIPC